MSKTKLEPKPEAPPKASPRRVEELLCRISGAHAQLVGYEQVHEGACEAGDKVFYSDRVKCGESRFLQVEHARGFIGHQIQQLHAEHGVTVFRDKAVAEVIRYNAKFEAFVAATDALLAHAGSAPVRRISVACDRAGKRKVVRVIRKA